MNEWPLLKFCHLEFNFLLCTFFSLNCLGGLNAAELLVLQFLFLFLTKSELINQIELFLAHYLLKKTKQSEWHKRKFLVDE